MARWQQVTIAAIGFAAALYAADYIAARTRAIATVEVAQYYAIPLKNGQTQFSFAGNQDIACVKSLFPHFGDRPCWYLDRNKEQWIRP